MRNPIRSLAVAAALSLGLACAGSDDPQATVAVQGLRIEPQQEVTTIGPGGSAPFTATIDPSGATDKGVGWTLSPSDAPFTLSSASGQSPSTVRVAAKADADDGATVTVTAAADGDATKKESRTVVVDASNVNVTGVTLGTARMDLAVGESQQISATVAPPGAADKYVTWSSGDAGVASVAPPALGGALATVHGVSAGSTTVTATTRDGGFAGTCDVFVGGPNVPVISVSLPQTFSVGVNRVGSLTATLTPPNATDTGASWSTDNSDVATVTGTSLVGAVSGVRAGSANITVTTHDGSHTAICPVTVEAEGPPSIYVAGRFGLYIDGVLDPAIGVETIKGVAVDNSGNVHATGLRYDASAPVPYAPVWYFNGEKRVLPTSLLGASSGPESSGNGIFATADGHVYIAGFEQINSDGDRVARLWRDGVQVQLLGVDETADRWSRANAVRVHNGNVYVAGHTQVTGVNSIRGAIWKDGQLHTMDAPAGIELNDIQFDSGGVAYVRAGSRIFRVSSDLSSLTEITMNVSGTIDDIFIDGADIWAAGQSGSDAYYWRNGDRFPLPRPAGTTSWSEAWAIFVHNGTPYIVGRTLRPSPATYSITLWIDGLVVDDDRTITDTFGAPMGTNPLDLFVE